MGSKTKHFISMKNVNKYRSTAVYSWINANGEDVFFTFFHKNVSFKKSTSSQRIYSYVFNHVHLRFVGDSAHRIVAIQTSPFAQ